MSTTTPASAAGTVAQPAVTPAPASVADATTSIPAPTLPAVEPKKEFGSALDFIQQDGDTLATRYGITEQPEAPVEPTGAPAPSPESAVADGQQASSPDATSGAPAAPEAPKAEPFTPITKFTLSDDQGELEIPANVKVKFNAGGKEHDLRIDEVVRMAQQAPNIEHQRATERQAAQQQIEQASAQLMQLQQELQRNNALYEQLLSDPALYQQAATSFQAMNTPEQRLARLQQQHEAERQQYQQTIQQTQLQQTITAAANYTASRIAPSVESLIQQHPAVDAGDVMAKFHELTAPLLAASPNGGVWVPPNRLAELESTVLPELTKWTQARAAKVQQASTAATQKANAEVQKAQLDAQLAKRQLARPLTPAGTPARADTPPPKPIKSSGDAIEAILAKASNQIRGAA